MRDLTNQEVMQLTGFPPCQISGLVSAGEITPKRLGKSGSGPGLSRSPSLWTPLQTLGLATGRGLRLIGVAPQYAYGVMRALAGMTEAKLVAEFSEGRTHIGVVGSFAHPALINKRDALENQELTAKTLTVIGDLPRAVNVERLWKNLQIAVSEIDKRRNPLLQTNNGNSSGIVPRAERFREAEMV